MQNLLIQTIRHIVTALLCEMNGHAPDSDAIERCAGFSAREWEALGAVPKIGIGALMVYLNCVAVVKHGKLFPRLSPQKAIAVLRSWQKSALSAKVSFFNLFFTLTVLAHYDASSVQQRIGIDRAAYLRMIRLYNSVNHD